MAITQLKITNLTTGPLSIDIPLDDRRQIRELLPLGGFVDVSSRATMDELNRSPAIQRLRGINPVATPKISVTAVEGADDLEGGTTQVVGRLVADTDAHMQLDSPGAGKTVRINNATKTGTADSNIGFQSKPGQGASTAQNVIGGEISPRLNNAIALTGSGSIIGLHVDAYLRGTTGNVAGDVRGMQIELVDDAGSTRTVTGDEVGLRFRSAIEHTVTGHHVPLKVEASEKATTWEAFAKIAAAANLADDTAAVNATQNGWIKVLIGTTARYLPLYTGTV